MSYKKILVAVDNRENSIIVAKKGFELAEQMNAEIALIFVVDISKIMVTPNPDILFDDALLALKKHTQESLNDIILKNNRSKDTLKFMPQGFPRDSILKTAYDWGADLIVIGLHGKTEIGIFVMGSISQYISIHSKIPVMIVPSKEK
jgi:nucleotide-binding universal stress UspA family protein